MENLLTKQDCLSLLLDLNRCFVLFFVIQEDDFVQLAAMYYYVTFGSAISGENAKKVVEECITTELIETKSQGKLIQLVNAAHTQVNCYSLVQ